jgi:hypothetical protein
VSQRAGLSDDSLVQLDARNIGILLGAAIVIGALWAPWYVLDMAAAREALGAAGTPQIPGVLGQFVREIAAALPDKISADAWEVFERGDVILLVTALAAAFAALMNRHEVSTFAGAGAAGLVVLAVLDKPGDIPSGLISVSWGPWLAFGGAALIVVSSRIGGSEKPDAKVAEVDWYARSEQMERARAAGIPEESWLPPAPSGSVPPPAS